MTFIMQACSNVTASGPFGESTDRCKGWSSLKCEGIPSKAFLKKLASKTEGLKYRGQLAATIEKITLADFLGRHKNELKRIRYLNGWDDNVTLDMVIKLSDSETIWIAFGGFLPEEFSKYENKYSFAEEDCAEQMYSSGKRA